MLAGRLAMYCLLSLVTALAGIHVQDLGFRLCHLCSPPIRNGLI